MGALIEVVLPVFLVLGFGYVSVWKGFFHDTGVEGLMKFTQNFAIPCLLFHALSTLDLGANFDARLLSAFYTGALASFFAGLAGARLIFRRPGPESVAVGFSTLFSNSVLLGLPIMQRAYGADALGPNYAIIAFHAPFCYIVGVLAMETVRARGQGLVVTLMTTLKSLATNALVIGIVLGLTVNLSGLTLPGPLTSAIEMMARAALPAALFGLGGVLVRYRPEGDVKLVAWICAVSLVLHPSLVWVMSRLLDLSDAQLRSAVVTAAMAPGVNTYVFANMYGVARRTAATGVLVATALSIITAWIWLGLLP